MINGQILVEKLIEYAKCFLYLNSIDETYVKNILFKKFNVKEPIDEVLDLNYIKDLIVPDSLVSEIESYAIENGLCDEYTKNLFSTDIMGVLTPMPSAVNKQFKQIKEMQDVQEACNFLYELSIKNNYIQKTAIEKNIVWQAEDGEKILEITINLSKPEKDNKEIARLLTEKKANYPKCLLCKENEGFEGNLNHPARENLRTISLKLDGENWFMQYSPYLYYNEHCIVINELHTPMKVNGKTLLKLADFIDLFPNYFIGSNASLPIVGGSILNHEHFQGGRHEMPMHKSKVLREFTSEAYPSVKMGVLDWYNSAIRLEGFDRLDVINLATEIIEKWNDYNDETVEILSHTGEVSHNAVTPIVRKDNNKYIIELILRNNRTSEMHEDGIFHAHKHLHNIKKEGIGIIEVMGLFILPGRLKNECEEMSKYLTGEYVFDKELLSDNSNKLYSHRDMIESLVKNNTEILSKEKAMLKIRKYINETCIKVLNCTAVFKKDEEGVSAFNRFMSCL